DAARVAGGLDLCDQPERVHVLDDPPAALEAIEPGVAAGFGRHLSVEADDGLDREVVAAPDLEVDRIMARSHLDDAGAELRIDRLVRDHLHRDRAVDRWHLERLAYEVPVPLVLRMDRQAGVAELRLRPHGTERDRTVLDVDELVVALLALHLDVGQNRLALRAPVDDVVVAVDQPFFPEPHERFAHRPREPASIVKRSRDQSHEAPSRRSCRTLWPPDSSFHCHARARYPSRPRSSFVLPSPASMRSRITCTAIDAWSIPGSQSVLKPSMRFIRVKVSCRVIVSA